MEIKKKEKSAPLCHKETERMMVENRDCGIMTSCLQLLNTNGRQQDIHNFIFSVDVTVLPFFTNLKLV